MAIKSTSLRKLACAGCLFSTLILPASFAMAAPADAPLQLERVVLLYRHGLRSPLPGEVQLNEASGKPWPIWKEAPSELTPRGTAEMQRMGRYDRQRLVTEGLFAAHSCPDKGQLWFWANAEQRTIASAQALAQGFSPGCPIEIGHLPEGSEDPLFHPIEAGATSWNARDAVAAIEASSGGPDALIAPHADALSVMATVMGCDQHHRPDWCMPDHWHGTLTTTPPSRDMTLSGPIATTSGTAEVILMAYAEGFPQREVGWGRVTPDRLESLSQLHALLFDIYARPDYMAERIASVLSHRVLDVLQDDSSPRLNVLVGSDNNIVALASILHLHFKMPSYAQDDPPIGGAMGIELWRNPISSQRYVRIFYEAQSLPQLRTLLSSPPTMRILLPPNCTPQGNGLCRLADIVPLLQRSGAFE